ncbi:alpha/beta hydrolase-fold protein [Nocardia sp. NPDC059239]|uniref:alpha/beta hydrolase-fold protein n=1 Tax=Nocardia sp. NPDC059239 TaxID=3346785 RepID=UPI0036921905
MRGGTAAATTAGVVGVSMSASGALMLAAYHRNQFACAAALSGLLEWHLVWWLRRCSLHDSRGRPRPDPSSTTRRHRPVAPDGSVR